MILPERVATYNRSMERLPPSVRDLFWEGLREEPDPERHAEYIALRVLEFGDEETYRWLVERYGHDWVRQVVTSGRLRPSQAQFWRSVLVDA
jgi:hypothetical protein